MKAWLLALVLALGTTTAWAQTSDPAPPRFHDATEETRFHALVTELRCVMCQNQSLADAVASLAPDVVLVDMARRGKVEYEIVRTLGRAGLLGLPYDEAYGGGAQPYEVYLQVLEEIASAWAGRSPSATASASTG